MPRPVKHTPNREQLRCFALSQQAKQILIELALPGTVANRLAFELGVLSQGPRTSSQMAEVLDVTARTIRRDMAILREHELVVLNGSYYELHEAWDQLDIKT
ncbi:helix-turn-helix domain-containing protein [Hymenobacter sp.]|uniref:helix-turn-helix domain-containing protein n=1 Tax=Hymenobacter sp. TaxID=1898978 RepID=UPI0039C8AB48